MKYVLKMKLTMNNVRLFAISMMAVTLGLVACGSKPATNGGDDYPMPGMPERCMNHLYDVLMSPEGRTMKGTQLAVLRDTGDLRNVFRIDLPTSSDDQLPRMGIYREAGEGATFEFLPLAAEDPLDTIHAVCQAVATFGYEGSTPDTLLVHNRGNGILTLFRYVHRGGPNGGKHRCYDKHPDGYPEFSTVVLSVFQGGDSLIISSGYEDSKCVYRYE